jgi:hypothetical protein
MPIGHYHAGYATCSKCSPTAHDASLGPEDLKAVKVTFDAAWLEIAGNSSTHPITVRVVRRRLAEALLSIATDNKRDVEALKRHVRNDVR